MDGIPATRRKFSGSWDELQYLYDKLLYWHYRKQDMSKSRKFADRIAAILKQLPNIDESIKGNEYFALINEVKGDWQTASYYRKREITLMIQIRELADHENLNVKKRIFEDFTPQDLADRYELLAIDLWKDGQLYNALNALSSSKKLSVEYGFKFDGEDLKKDIEKEQRGT